MLRIIAGRHRGRKIAAKDGASIRPTGARTREAIFNILVHGHFGPEGGSPLMGRRVVDLFCGTGALGLEALSRGAEHVTFIDQSGDSVALARTNAQHLGEEANAQFVRNDSTQLPPARQPCHLAFLDPPYGKNLAPKALASLAAQHWLVDGAVVLVELGARDELEAPEGFTAFDERKYGNSRVVLLRFKSPKKAF